MLPLREKLVWYHQYKEQETYFPIRGTIGVYGENGAGKSTLMDFRWILFGTIPKGIKKEMIRNQQAPARARTYAELVFLHEEKFVEVHRDLKSDDRTVVFVNGVLRAKGGTAVSEFIQNLLKMNSEEFTACYYAAQKDFDKLVNITDAKRIEAITHLFSIEAYDIAVETAKKENKELKEEKERLEKELNFSNKEEYTLEAIQKQNEKIEEYTKEIKEFDKDIEAGDQKYKNLLVQKENGETEYIQHQNWISQKNNIQEQIHELNTRNLKPSQEKLQNLRKKEKRQEELEKVVEKHYEPTKNEKEKMEKAKTLFEEKTNLLKEEEENVRDLQNAKQELEEIQKELEELQTVEENLTKEEKNDSELDGKIKHWTQQKSDALADMRSLREKNQELKDTIESLETLGREAPCPTCRIPLGDHLEDSIGHIRKEMLEVRKRYISLKDRNGKIEIKLQQLQVELAVCREQIKTLRGLSVHKAKLEEKIKGKKKEIERLQLRGSQIKKRTNELSEIVFHKEKYDKLSANLEKLIKYRDEMIANRSLLEEIPSINKTIADLNHEIQKKSEKQSEITIAIQKLNFDEPKYKGLMANIEEKKKEVDEFRQKKHEKEMQIVVVKESIKKIQDKIKAMEKIQKRIHDIEMEMLEIEFTIKMLQETKIDVLATIRPDLSDTMSEFLELITDGRVREAKLDEKYNISMYRKGIENPLAFYSGGNQDLAALCLRFAISKNLSNQKGQSHFGMMILDEIFSHLDVKRQANMIDMLRTLNLSFPQIFLISHSESTKGAFDYVLEVKIDNEEFSVLKWETDWDQEATKKVIEEYQNKFEQKKEEKIDA